MEELTASTQSQDDRPSLGKQILGAVIGGTLALGLYYVYDVAKPKVTAYLTLPAAEGGRMYDVGAANIADKTMDDDERKRIVSRNLRAANVLQDNIQNDPSTLASVDTHELDIAWPGHDETNPKYAEVMAKTVERPSVEGVPMQKEEAVMMDKEQMMAEEMATMNMQAEDGNWNGLWEDIRDREHEEMAMEHSDADDLPDTGFGLGFLVAGAAGSAFGARRKKKA